jgi:hypothetical protein
LDRIDLTSGKVAELAGHHALSPEVKNGGKRLAQDRADHLVLTSDLSLVDATTGEAVRSREECDLKYGNPTFRPVAAFLDDKGKNWVASAGSSHLMRVTQLETGADLAFFPTEGRPSVAQFSKDGKRLFILSEDEDHWPSGTTP